MFCGFILLLATREICCSVSSSFGLWWMNVADGFFLGFEANKKTYYYYKYYFKSLVEGWVRLCVFFIVVEDGTYNGK